MVPDRHKQPVEGLNAVLKTARPRLFRRASITSWGKDDLKMTRTAADINLKEFMLTVQQQKYEDEDKATQREISRTVSLEHQEKIRWQRERRERWLQRSHEKKDFIIKWEREGRSKWNANQAAMCRYERRLLNYELALRETATARRRISRARHTTDVVEGIRCFEENLDRLGLDAGCGVGGAGDGLGPGKKNLLPGLETGPAFRSRLLRKVLDQKFVPASNAETMAELRFKGNAARRARQERENRRVKAEVVKKNAKRETDAQRSADDHLRLLLEKGQSRRKTAASFWEKERTREAEAAVRQEWSVNKSVAQQAAFETAFNVRAASTRVRHAALNEDREARSHAVRARRESAREEKRRHTESMCLAIAQKIADLAVIASEARMNQGGMPLLPTVWGHLKRWFCSADPFFPEESSSEAQPEPHDSVLEAKACIEGLNLDRCEADWRPRGVACTGFPPPPSPLEEALSVAWDLVGATGPGPREVPMHKALQSDGCSDIGSTKGSMSIRMVVLGKREGLHDMCAELGRWVNLYVCRVDTVLECAMEIGAEVVSSDAKSVKGKRKSTARKGATKSKHKGNGVSVEDSESLAEKEAEAKTKAEALARTAFDPDASEEQVAAFKEAATAYFNLRSHPKKSALPVPVSMTVDLLVKHLSCRAPKGQGWILVGYPRTLIESKMLEHALSGYTDEDVAMELNGGGKKDKKKKRRTVLNPIEQPEIPRSGLDAIVNLVRIRPDVEDEVSRANDENVEKQAASDSTKDIDGRQQEKVRNEGRKRGSKVGNDCEEGVPDIDAAEASDCRTWWEGFEGGHLACDVLDEASDERLLETLFLLANAAQKRKNEYEISRQNDEISTEQVSVEGTTTEPLAKSGEECADPQPTPNTTEIIDPISPLAIPITTLLEDLRRERRAGMSHATRIRVEALAGERSLDLQGVWSVINRADGLVGSESGASTSPWMKAMRKMESICGTSSVVDWTADVEHAFARSLRSSDDGWVAACARLEDGLVGWLGRFDKTIAGATAGRRERWGRRTVDGLKSGGNGGNVTSFDLTTTSLENYRAWEVLEEFELAAGDVTDDRHASAEVTMASIDSEATQRVHCWAENAARSTVELCAAERLRYREVVRAVCDLHRLMGLRRDCSADPELAVLSARVAADALEKEVAAVSERQVFSDSSRRGLVQELCSAIEEVHPQGETKCIPRENTDAESSNPGYSSDKSRSAVQEAIAQAGRGTCEVDYVRAESYLSSESATSGASLDTEEGAHEEEGCDRSLDAAVWCCREIYVSRCRGIIARLGIAVSRCETVAASVKAALRGLNRRRVQLEHSTVTATTLAVRRALEEYDYIAIREILENGIPVCVEDNETFAADPHVALPWGMSGLDLDQIASLARSLRSTLARAFEGESGIPDSTVPVKDLVRAVLAWSDSAGTEHRGIRSLRGNQMPPFWVGGTGGYVEALCRAVGTEAGRVPWRRLIHCLLLGHIRSVPSVEDLRSMRHSFTREESRSLSPAGLSIGAHSARPNSAGVMATAGEETVADPENASDDTQQQQQLEIPSVSLCVEQRQFHETPLWFEVEEKSDDKEAEDATAAAVAIKTVYAETWTGEDGRLDGMDLLLTLCMVPAANNNAMSTSRDSLEDDSGKDGIPFSLGLFRAFMMLAEVPELPSTRDLTTTGTTAAPGCIPEDEKSLPASITSTTSIHVRRNSRESSAVIGATASKFVDDRDESQRDFVGSDPRVTLPFLRAILLEHGVGLLPAEVSGVSEAATRDQRRVELKKKVRQQNVGDHDSGSGSAVATSGCIASEGAESVAYGRGNADLTGRTNGDEGSTPGAEKVGTRRDEGAQSVGTEVSMDRERDTTEDVPDAAGRGELEQPDPHYEDPSRVIDGESVSSGSGGNPPLEEPEPPPTVSFSEACECEAVRAWVRRGAYSLPPFEVTSGRRTRP